MRAKLLVALCLMVPGVLIAQTLAGGLSTGRGAATLSATGTQDVGSIAAQTCTVFTIAMVGAVTSDPIFCAWPSSISSGLVYWCNAGTDVAAFRLCNVTAGAIDPASGTYAARVIR